MVIDYVVPDYYAHRPKACMADIQKTPAPPAPAGKVLPCHAAETLPGFDFPSVTVLGGRRRHRRRPLRRRPDVLYADGLAIRGRPSRFPFTGENSDRSVLSSA